MLKKWNEWCFRPQFCTVRLYWAGDNLGTMMTKRHKRQSKIYAFFCLWLSFSSNCDIYLLTFLSVYLYVYTCMSHLSICFCLFVCLISYVYMSVCLSVYLFVCPLACLLIHNTYFPTCPSSYWPFLYIRAIIGFQFRSWDHTRSDRNCFKTSVNNWYMILYDPEQFVRRLATWYLPAHLTWTIKGE